jgi:hypothetical protein
MRNSSCAWEKSFKRKLFEIRFKEEDVSQIGGGSLRFCGGGYLVNFLPELIDNLGASWPRRIASDFPQQFPNLLPDANSSIFLKRQKLSKASWAKTTSSSMFLFLWQLLCAHRLTTKM